MKKLPKIENLIAPFNYKDLIPCRIYHFKKLPIVEKSFNLEHLPKIVYSQILNSFKQLSPHETQHSRIICDLLNPANPAVGYGNIFLELFFKYVLNDSHFEYDETDIWKVTAGKEYFDIRIGNQDNSKIIIIENKSNWAEDQPNQLYRYWYHGIYTLQKDMACKYCKMLYLSPSEYKKYDKQSITKPDYIQELYNEAPGQLDEAIIKTVFFHTEITAWLDECMKFVEEEVGKKDNVYYYLLQYKDFWGNIMANEIVKQVESYFSEKEQWDTFLELSNQRGDLLASWYLSLKNALHKRFLTESVDVVWGFTTWGNWDYSWFLNEYGNDYVRIWLYQQSLHFWINPEKLDLAKATGLLKTEKYSKILAAFECLQEPHLDEPQNPYKMVERGNFSFGDRDDGQISPEKFAWYAHYKTDDVVEQIVRKINRFREKEVTDLIKELIEEAKLQQ